MLDEVQTSTAKDFDFPTENSTQENNVEAKIQLDAEDAITPDSTASISKNECKEVSIKVGKGSKTNRELKSILALSKEANLSINIEHKRKSIEPLDRYSETFYANTPSRPNTPFRPNTPIRPNTPSNKRLRCKEKPNESVDKIEVGSKCNKSNQDGSRELNAEGVVTEPESERFHRTAPPVIIMDNKKKDSYCWKCHTALVTIHCSVCPRSFHRKCVKQSTLQQSKWMCPDCLFDLKPDDEKKSSAVQKLSVNQLSTLLSYAVQRMMQVEHSKPFLEPVDEVEFPLYKDYVLYSMDFETLKKKIQNPSYNSTQQFEAEVKWILHNSIIFNGFESEITHVARSILRVCKQEITEIENCANCYLNANTKKMTWFTEVCPKPHLIVWAKLKHFPFWPGKVMRSNSTDMSVDVRFFGDHDRAWIKTKNCFLYSVMPPTSSKKSSDLTSSLEELEVHLNKLRKIFGEFREASYRTPFRIDQESEQLQQMLPGYNKNLPNMKEADNGKQICNQTNDTNSTPVNSKPVTGKRSLIDENKVSSQQTKVENNLKRRLSSSSRVPGKLRRSNSHNNLNIDSFDTTANLDALTSEDKHKIMKKLADEEVEKTNRFVQRPATCIPFGSHEDFSSERQENLEEVEGDTSMSVENVSEISETEKMDTNIKSINESENANIQSSSSTLNITDSDEINTIKKSNSISLTVIAKTKSSDELIKDHKNHNSVVEKVDDICLQNSSETMLQGNIENEITLTPINKSNINTLINTEEKSQGNKIDIQCKKIVENGESHEKKEAHLSHEGNARIVSINVIGNKTRKVDNKNQLYCTSVSDAIQSNDINENNDAENIQNSYDHNNLLLDTASRNQASSNSELIQTQYMNKKRKYLSALNISEKMSATSRNKTQPDLQPETEILQPITSTSSGITNVTSNLNLKDCINDEITLTQITKKEQNPSTTLCKSQVVNRKARKSFPVSKAPNFSLLPENAISQYRLVKPMRNLYKSPKIIKNIMIVTDPKTASTSANSSITLPPNQTISYVPNMTTTTLQLDQPGPNASPQMFVPSPTPSPPNPIADRTEIPSESQNYISQSESKFETTQMRNVAITSFNVSSSDPNYPANSESNMPRSLFTDNFQIINSVLPENFRNVLTNNLRISTSKLNSNLAILQDPVVIQALNQQRMDDLVNYRSQLSELMEDVETFLFDDRESLKAEFDKHLEEIKLKQWCSNCFKEAQFYCCWNTSYCSKSCQLQHWETHMPKCAQNIQRAQLMHSLTTSAVQPLNQNCASQSTASKKIFIKRKKAYMMTAPIGARNIIPIDLSPATTSRRLQIMETPDGKYMILDESIDNVVTNRGPPRAVKFTTTEPPGTLNPASAIGSSPKPVNTSESGQSSTATTTVIASTSSNFINVAVQKM